MQTLREALERYLSLRRGLGAALRGPGGHLHRFVEFLEGEGAAGITCQLALRWATAPVGATPATWALRLADVRRFAAWLSATEPGTEVPPPGLLPHRYRRRPPYIYSDDEIARILGAAARLPSRSGLRAQTAVALFGVLAKTGLRLGEALDLDRDDVDLHAGVLAIRRAKFGTSRFGPVHDSAGAARKRSAQQRDRLPPRPAYPAFFLAGRGIRVTPCSARYTFAVVGRFVEFYGTQRVLAERVLGLRRAHLPRGGFAFTVGFPIWRWNTYARRALAAGVAVVVVARSRRARGQGGVALPIRVVCHPGGLGVSA